MRLPLRWLIVVAAPELYEALSSGSAALARATDLVLQKHDAATSRQNQAFRTWHADAPAAEPREVATTNYAFPSPTDAPLLFRDGAPCAAVTKQPLFSADECAWIVEEAERAGRWTPQEFRYARDVVQQVEDLAEVRPWLEEACRDQIFPLLQATFPEVVGEGAAARDALRIFDAKILRYDAALKESYLGPHRDGTLLTAVTALNPLDAYAGGGTSFEALDETIRYDAGHVCCHAGEIRHGGARVTSGRRYALVCFVDSADVFEPARALANAADAQRLRGDLDEALKLYDFALESGHSNELAWCGKGQVALEKGRFAEAASCYAEAVGATPTHAVAWTNLGVAFARVGKGDIGVLREAVMAFEEAADLDQAEPAPLNNLGLLLGDLKSHEAAVDAFQRALDRAEFVPARERADLHTNLGVELVELDDLAGALGEFQKAIEVDPSHQGAAANVIAMRSALSGGEAAS